MNILTLLILLSLASPPPQGQELMYATSTVTNRPEAVSSTNGAINVSTSGATTAGPGVLYATSTVTGKPEPVVSTDGAIQITGIVSLLNMTYFGQGVSSANTTQYNAFYNSTTHTYSIGTNPLTSAHDVRMTYNAAAPSATFGAGGNFYLTVSPSSSVDLHSGMYAAVNGTTYSNDAGILAQIAGGNFTAIRNTISGGSTNPVYGSVSTSVMGDGALGGSAVTADGGYGALNTVYVSNYQNNNTFDFFGDGTAGQVGRAFINNTYSLSTRSAVGNGGYVNMETGIADAMGGYFGAGSVSHTTALAANIYGIRTKAVSGAKNGNWAAYFDTGTVHVSSNMEIGGNVVGNITVTQASTVTAVAATPQTAGGGKTYTYKVQAILTDGTHSACSNAVTTADGKDNLATDSFYNNVTWNPVEGATGGYKVYRTVAGGATTNTTGLIATVSQNIFTLATPAAGFENTPAATQTIPNYFDVGAAGDSSTCTDTNTTGNLTVPLVVPIGSYASSADETATIADTTLFTTSAAGQYRFAIYINSNNTCATPGLGAVTVGAKWTDITSVQKSVAALPLDVNGSTTLASSVPLGDVTSFGTGTFTVYAKASTAIIFNTTLTACTSGTAKYRGYVTVQRTQ